MRVSRPHASAPVIQVRRPREVCDRVRGRHRCGGRLELPSRGVSATSAAQPLGPEAQFTPTGPCGPAGPAGPTWPVRPDAHVSVIGPRGPAGAAETLRFAVRPDASCSFVLPAWVVATTNESAAIAMIATSQQCQRLMGLFEICIGLTAFGSYSEHRRVDTFIERRNPATPLHAA